MVSRVKLILIGLCLNVLKTNWGEGQPIDLMFSEEEQSICVDEIVVFTCSVTGAGILTWGIGPHVNISKNPIRLRLRDNSLNVGYTFYGRGGLYNATVTSVSPDPANGLLGNLSSELHVVVVAGQRIQVQCGDDTNAFQTIIIPPAEPPSLPRNLNFSFETYGISNYSVRIHWESATEHEGVNISNYILTTRPLGMTNETITEFHTKQFSVETLFLYNHEYEVSVAAENCNGISENVSIFISKVSCGHPSSLANGTIEPYSSTQEGAVIQYHCNEGHIPMEWMTSQCLDNGTWSFDTAQYGCTLVDCGPPNTTSNANLTFTATTYNSTATYMRWCRSLPEVYDTVCTIKGEWEPDPIIMKCREPVECTAPASRKDASFNYSTTTVGSKMTITCNESPSLQEGGVEFLCNSNGSWTPDPTGHYCYEVEQKPGSSAGVASGVVVAIVVAVTGVVIVCIGITLIFAWRRKLSKGIMRGTIEENSYVEAGPNFLGQYSELQPPQELNRKCSRTVQYEPPTAANVSTAKTLTYAEVGPQASTKSRPPPSLDETRVQYSSVWHNAVVEPLPSELLLPADKSMNLDQLLIQLQEVEPHWMALGQAAGLEEQWLQRVKSQASSDHEAMIEVVDGWLAKLYPNKPTWKEVADVVEQIGHLELSRSLRQVYVTGFLPIEVSNAVPSSPTVKTTTAPPLPPRQTNCRDIPPRTSLHTMEQPPPLPPKLSRTTPRD